jgi:5-methylcytosine-specific restriction protein A
VKVPSLRPQNPIADKAVIHKRRGRSPARLRILQRDNFTCNKCDESYPETYLNVDHCIPISQGGPDTDANKQTLCIPCHKAKSDTEKEGRKLL